MHLQKCLTFGVHITGRVLFIKDGEVFHQLYRGDETDSGMYQKISDTLTMIATGGEIK